MMRRWAASVGLWVCCLAGAAYAQDPLITVTVEQEEVIVGQPYVLRLKVLVPTFMPKAPVFPSFEGPGLIVRLPERSTSPISERIEGATWAGVQRTYRIYPMRAGITEMPQQQLSLVYRDTESNKDVPFTIKLPARRITATVPLRAGALDPLLLANGLSIEQTWEMADEELAVGDVVIRRLEMSIAGASALFIPPLLDSASPQGPPEKPSDEGQPVSVAGFAPYPEDARVTESLERGVMSGKRTETVSYVAQSGGSAVFPPLMLEWYNLERNEVEEIVLPGRRVLVAQPMQRGGRFDRQAVLRSVFILVAMAALGWVAFRGLRPIVRPRLQCLNDHYRASVFAAHRMVEKKAAAGDLNGVFLALEQRSARGNVPGEALEKAIEALGRALYRDGAAQDATAGHWRLIQKILRKERWALITSASPGSATKLPPLNPFV